MRVLYYRLTINPISQSLVLRFKKYTIQLTDFDDVMPRSQSAAGERHITSGHVPCLVEMWLSVVCHVVEADNCPRDHIGDHYGGKYEQIF